MTDHEWVLEWLKSGVPLTLLMDLASPRGPDSAEIARQEQELSR